MDRDDPAYRGQSDYTRLLLRLYDPLVLGPVARFVWRCPTSRLVEGYRRHIRDHHLDVGPGTGYFIEQSGLPDGSRVTILDPNRNVLDDASRTLHRLDVTAAEADVLKPLPVQGPFASAALHLVIHCLPGPTSHKAKAVTNVAAPSDRLASCSAPRSSGRRDRRRGCRAVCSPPSTGGAHSTTSTTPRRASTTSWRRRSNTWSSRRLARSRSSRQRIRVRPAPDHQPRPGWLGTPRTGSRRLHLPHEASTIPPSVFVRGARSGDSTRAGRRCHG
jgi:hypothetical protein